MGKKITIFHLPVIQRKVLQDADEEADSLSTAHLFDVIYEDADLLVINKPAGLVCHPTKGDEYSSLISRIRLHLPPGTTSHLVNRLDRETQRRDHCRPQQRRRR